VTKTQNTLKQHPHKNNTCYPQIALYSVKNRPKIADSPPAELGKN
jgi:hypothetical protein